MIYKVSTIQGGAGFLPPTVCCGTMFHNGSGLKINWIFAIENQILPKYRGENMEKTETILEKSWGYPLFGQPLALLVQTGV